MCSLALYTQSILLKDFEVSLEVRLLVLVELSFVDAHAVWIFDVGNYLRNQDFVISSIFLFVDVSLLFLEVRYIQIVSFGGSKLKLLWLLLKSGATCIVIEIAKDFCQLRWILILCTKLFQAQGIPLHSCILLLARAKVAVLHLLLQHLQEILVVTALKILQLRLQCLLVQAAELHGV